MEISAEWEKTRRFLLELYSAERAIIEHDAFDPQAKLDEAEEIAHQHLEPTIAGHW